MLRTRPSLRLACGALAGVGLLVSAAPAQEGKDKIFKSGSEKATSGKITEENLSEVVYTDGGATIKERWPNVARIVYGDGDGPFRKAEEAIGRGDFAGAITILEPLKPTTLREIFVPRRLFLLGRALESSGKAKEAEATYGELVSKYEKSRYCKDAIRALIELQIKGQNFPGAVSTADRGIKLAGDLKLDDLRLSFRFNKAMVLEAQNKLAEADAEYRAVASDAAQVKDASDVAMLATIGQARLAAKQGDVAKAKTLLEPAFKSTNPVILGPAYQAMGEALLTQGIKEQNADRLVEAAWLNFDRTIVQFPPSGTESTDALEQAMYGFVRACKRLSEIAKPKEQAEFWKVQGLATCKEFQDRFATSRLARAMDDLRKEFK